MQVKILLEIKAPLGCLDSFRRGTLGVVLRDDHPAVILVVVLDGHVLDVGLVRDLEDVSVAGDGKHHHLALACCELLGLGEERQNRRAVIYREVDADRLAGDV